MALAVNKLIDSNASNNANSGTELNNGNDGNSVFSQLHMIPPNTKRINNNQKDIINEKIIVNKNAI